MEEYGSVFLKAELGIVKQILNLATLSIKYPAWNDQSE